jgi:peptidoglycan/LPS O-acetylase OafA/YrhL
VFADQAVPAVNGALWTLKMEAAYYLLVPVIFAAVQKSRRPQASLYFLIVVSPRELLIYVRQSGGCKKVVQILYVTGLFSAFALGVTASIALVVCMSLMSFVWVERPALRLVAKAV